MVNDGALRAIFIRLRRNLGRGIPPVVALILHDSTNIFFRLNFQFVFFSFPLYCRIGYC